MFEPSSESRTIGTLDPTLTTPELAVPPIVQIEPERAIETIPTLIERPEHRVAALRERIVRLTPHPTRPRRETEHGEIDPRTKAIFVHMGNEQGLDNRFDTEMMVNGSVAALTTIADRLGVESVAIDESFTGSRSFDDVLHGEIEGALKHGQQLVVFTSVLSYNAEQSLRLLEELKAHYGDRVRTGVGGQLIRVAPQAYRRKNYIDHVAVGDAEVTLGKLLAGESFASGYLFRQPSEWNFYAAPSYERYVAFEERLQAMSMLELESEVGMITGVRQAVVENVRGCAWGHASGVCRFCSLESIDTEPRYRPLPEQFEVERSLVERWKANWVFDVSNQWLPRLNRKEEWLEAYLEARRAASAPNLDRYVYLTVNSITRGTAPLLREAGVRTAFVGLDGWTTEVRKAHGKAESVMSCLRAARDSQLLLRAGLVIGEGATEENLGELQDFVRLLASEYHEPFLSLVTYIEIVLQGSPVWYAFLEQARREQIEPVLALYQKMETEGYLSWDDHVQLTRYFFQHSPTCHVDYETAVAAQQEVVEFIQQSGKIGYSYELTQPDLLRPKTEQ